MFKKKNKKKTVFDKISYFQILFSNVIILDIIKKLKIIVLLKPVECFLNTVFTCRVFTFKALRSNKVLKRNTAQYKL